MAIINTQQLLIDYIRRRLGEPLINVEVTNDQIQDIIDDVIQKYTDFAYQGETNKSFILTTTTGVTEYTLDPEISNVIQVKGQETSGAGSANLSGNSFNLTQPVINVNALTGGQPSSSGSPIEALITSMTNISTIEALFAKDVNYNYNPSTNKLIFLETPDPKYILYTSVFYTPGAVDRIYNHEWVKKMCVSKVKFLWGTVTGKFSQTLVSGATINYNDMKSEAAEEISKLDEELMSRYLEPAPITVG